MSFVDNNGNNGMIMPVAPMYGGGFYGGNGGFGNGSNGFGGDGAWWLLVLLFALGNNGWGGNGFGNGAGGAMPYILNNSTNSDVQRGFDQSAVMSGINSLTTNVCNGFGDVQLGIAGVNQNICQTGNQITSAVTNGFAQSEIADNARQIANMQQSFNSQTAITGGLTNLQSQLAQCCCDNRLATANLQSTILSENCADRAAISDGIRDVVTNQTANTNALLNTINNGIQSIQDKLCQQEIDALKERNASLQNQIIAQNIRAEGLANRAAILADNAAQTQALEQYLNPNCCNYNNWYNNCGGFNG